MVWSLHFEWLLCRIEEKHPYYSHLMSCLCRVQRCGFVICNETAEFRRILNWQRIAVLELILNPIFKFHWRVVRFICIFQDRKRVRPSSHFSYTFYQQHSVYKYVRNREFGSGGERSKNPVIHCLNIKSALNWQSNSPLE